MVENIGTHSGFQLQAIGTQGCLCFECYPVCVPHNENTECVSNDLRTVYGWVGFAWTGSVCALFG